MTDNTTTTGSEVISSNSQLQTRWQHKENKRIFNVVPWWDCQCELIDKPQDIINDDEWSERLYAMGVLAQVGYLIENEDGIWFGVGPGAKVHFDDLGPLPSEQINETSKRDDNEI